MSEQKKKYTVQEMREAAEELASVKARLNAVVKELEYLHKFCAFAMVDPEDVDVILRLARGDGGAE